MSGLLQRLARECGFELAGVAPAGPVSEWGFYRRWVEAGMAAGMRYLTDRRALVRQDVRNLLPAARSVICVGKFYNRYAAEPDYHDVLRAGLERLAARLAAVLGPFDRKICVDTAPLLERALARRAGLGWIGRNTCLINQPLGSRIFLGELITSLDLEPDQPPPDRCGTCMRCIEACPTHALVPLDHRWVVDSRLCLSTLAPGCEICQEVCPWNRRAPLTRDPAFAASRPS
jgi:epoxyqueuosine reductase